jgi:hypothetical protein
MSRRLARMLALLGLALLLAPAAAHADFGFVPGSFQAQNVDAGGQPDLRAGGHPDRLLTSFAFNVDGAGGAVGNAKDVVVDMPAGFAGNARALPACPRTVFVTTLTCPSDTQVGVMAATFAGLGATELPIYNVEPQPGEAAEFAFPALILPVRMVATVRADGDDGTSIELRDLPQSVPLLSAQITLWGIPADHQTSPTAPRRALLTNPTRCDQAPVTVLRARSWAAPERWIAQRSSAPGPLTGCDAVAFQPAVSLALDAPTADTPTGMRLDVALPQQDDPDGRASSQLRDLDVTLPSGITLSPGLADGLVACDDAQLGVGSLDPPACPPASKIGAAELRSPLAGTLTGSLYLGRPLPGDPYRMFLTAAGPGFFVKLTGSLRADPTSAQLTAVFDGLPQLTFDELTLRFKGGPRAPLATPAMCGVAGGSARLTPYSTGATVTLPTSIAIGAGPGGGPCPARLPFAPQLLAGATPPVAGAASSFSFAIRRADGDQALERVALTLPPGLSARLASVAPCSAAQAAAAACSPASRIGTVAAEAGAGSQPLPLSGDAYLTGPYRDAPYGIALVIRAQAGPLDLGTVVVLGTLRVDPLDGSLTIATQALPSMLGGVPLRLQTVALTVDRPDFMVNPTSCRPAQIAASIRSVDFATVQRQLRFALGDCRRLPFRPGVSLALSPAAALRDGGHPALRVELRSGAGQAAVRSAAIELPGFLTLHQTAVTAICSRAQAREGRCPSASHVGVAVARTPLLPHPLRGPVSVVQPRGTGQPDLWATLAGDGIRLSLRSTVARARGRSMVTRFVDLPDVPLSRFVLTLHGGAHGALAATARPCRGGRARRLAVGAQLIAQSGLRRALRVAVHAHPDCAR